MLFIESNIRKQKKKKIITLSSIMKGATIVESWAEGRSLGFIQQRANG